jgi:hypothetical protein
LTFVAIILDRAAIKFTTVEKYQLTKKKKEKLRKKKKKKGPSKAKRAAAASKTHTYKRTLIPG